MNILVDFHHSSLLLSHILLFEKRLGHKVYRPIGMEWYERGYWNVYPHIDTAKQYLSTETAYKPADGTPPLNEIDKIEDGIYYCKDVGLDTYNRAITLDKFMEMDFDIILCSIPQHVDPFMRLAKAHPNYPKLIFQIGNQWRTEGSKIMNIMSSVKLNYVPPHFNYVQYNQEFPRQLFKTTPPTFSKKIYSFMNCFSTDSLFLEDYWTFLEVENFMKDYEFKSFGGQCRDGFCDGPKGVSEKMAEAQFVWHTKKGGDGYGHIIHNAAAMGKPLITVGEYYKGKKGEKFMRDGIDAICIDGLNGTQIINKIRHYSKKDQYERLVRNLNRKFENRVDFAKDSVRVNNFLNNLK